MRSVTRRIVVTGATGFLGRRVTESLTSSGSVVLPMGLPGERLKLPGAFFGDITSKDLSFPECDAVVHCAGVLESSHPSKGTIFKVNLEGTKNVLTAAVEAGVKKFVLISSIMAMGPQGRTGRPMDERTPPKPTEPYGLSKLQAERYLKENAYRSGISVAALRPPVLYGPGMSVHSSAMKTFVSIRDGKMPLVSGGRNVFNLLYVDNMVHAIALTLDENTQFATYIVSEGPYTLKHVVDAISGAMGVKNAFIRFPKPVLWAATAAFSIASPLMKGPPPLSWTKYKALTTDCWSIDHSLIGKKLGYLPPVSLSEGVARTCAHYGWSTKDRRVGPSRPRGHDTVYQPSP